MSRLLESESSAPRSGSSSSALNRTLALRALGGFAVFPHAERELRKHDYPRDRDPVIPEFQGGSEPLTRDLSVGHWYLGSSPCLAGLSRVQQPGAVHGLLYVVRELQ